MQKNNHIPNLDEYCDVWILAEHSHGKIRHVALELLGKGRELANSLDVKLVALLLGNNVKDQCRQLIHYGADKVILVDDPKLEHYQTGVYADVITQQILNLFQTESF